MKTIKRIFISLILLFILVFGSIISYVYWKQDDIEQMVISEISLQLKSDILIEDVSISAIKSFPFVSLTLDNLTAFDAFQTDTLCQIDQLSVSFNALDLYHQNYIIQNLNIKNGKAVIYYIDSVANYEIWYSDSTSNSKSELEIGLENITLDNFTIEYRSGNMTSSIHSHESKIELALDGINIEMKLKGQLTNNQFLYDNTSYLANQPINLEADMLMDSLGMSVRSEVEVAQIPLTLDVSTNDQFTKVSINTSTIDLASVFDLIPKTYLTSIEPYDIDGKSQLSIDLLNDHLSMPKIDVDFTYNNGSIKGKNLPFDIDGISLSGSYTNGKQRNNASTQIKLSNINCMINNESINGNATINGLDNPNINTNISTQIQLSDLESYGYKAPVEHLSGKALLDLFYDGHVGMTNSMEYDVSMAQKTARINVDNLHLKVDSTSPSLSNAILDVKLENNHLDIERFYGFLEERNDIEFIGALENIFSYFLLKNAPLKVAGTLTSKAMNMDDFMFESESDNNSSSTPMQAIVFPQDITANINIKFEDVTYDRLHLRNLVSQLSYKENQLRAKNIELETMSGKINSDIRLKQLRSGKLRLISTTNLNNINVRQLFYEFKNFGQETMRHKHLKGKINSEIYFRNEWDNLFNPIDGLLYSFIDVTIKDGELLEFEPMMLMSDYISVEELKRIKFSTLENQIEIKNNLIEIPFMEINSSATDIACAGTYSFDGEMNFDIKVLLNEILGNKFRRKNKKKVSEFEIIEEKNSKGMALFLKMEGTADNPIVSPNTFKLKESLNDEFKKEKRKLKDVIKKEFNNQDNTQEIENPDYNKIVEWEE